jgi:hypothetical protein
LLSTNTHPIDMKYFAILSLFILAACQSNTPAEQEKIEQQEEKNVDKMLENEDSLMEAKRKELGI